MKKNIIKSFSFLALILVALLTLAGCNKVTNKNYKKIKTDMTKAKVVDILGEEMDSTMYGDYTVLYWFDGAKNYQEACEKVQKGKTVKYIEVTLQSNKVVTKNFGNFAVEE